MVLPLLALGLVAPTHTPTGTPLQAFVGATLVNPGQEPIPDAVVLVQDGRILAAGPARTLKVPAHATRLEVGGKWIVPGLVDAHIHFFQSGGLYTRPDVMDLRAHRSYEQEQGLIRRDLPDTFARYLRCGITSVIDMGGPNWNFEVRDLATRTLRAPRVWLSGPLLAPSAIKNFRTGGSHFLTEGKDPAVLHGMTPEQARAEVRRQAGLKTDFIKIWVSRERTTDTQQAIYDEARKHGLRVAMHATRLAEAAEAVKAGADLLVHNVEDAPIPEDLMQEMKRRGVILVPTLIVNRGYSLLRTRRFAFDPWEFALGNPHVMGTFFDLLHLGQPLSEAQVKVIREARPWEPGSVALDNVRRLVRAGVTVAAGTDAGNPGTFPGPSLWTELKLMAQAGLTPQELLQSVTLNGAKVLGKEKDHGTVEAGKVADLLVLDADPYADIQNLQKLHRVVKGGEVLVPEEILQASPEDVVQRQLNAYNARDAEAFAATYAPEVTIRTLPETPITVRGREAVKAKWGAMFLAKPDTAVRITHHMAQGPFVIEQEQFVHRWDPKQTAFAGTAIYEVRQGLIQTVWFLKDPAPPK